MKKPRQIPLAVVQRVTGRLLMGLPMKLALSLEDCAEINEGSWAKAIKGHPQWPPRKALSSERWRECLKRLDKSGDCRHLVWALENRFPEDFAAPPSNVKINLRTE